MTLVRQPGSGPNLDGGCWPFRECSSRIPVGLLCSGQGDDKVDLRAAVENVTDGAEHAILLSESPKSIDVHRNKLGCLKDQLFVGHHILPRWARDQNKSTS